MKGYFGKVDSQHPGNENDPRVSLIEVVPENVRPRWICDQHVWN